jgi:uncharacterized surface protein with fasciclin (FAS1) repeats
MFNSIKKISNFLLAGLMVSSALVSCKKDKNEDNGSGGNGNLANSLVSKIGQDADLNYIKDAIGIAGLSDTLSKAGEFTFFAPVDEALDSLGVVINNTTDYTAQEINETLRYHIVKGVYRSGDVPANADNEKLFTINTPADSVFVTKTSTGSIYVNGVKVDDAKKDITVENGVIHKLVNDKATNQYGFLYAPEKKNIYDFIKTYRDSQGRAYFDSIAKIIDRAATVDPSLITALKTQVVTAAIPLDVTLVPFLQAIGGINALPANALLSIVNNHIILKRTFLINLAIAGTGGTTTKSNQKLKYGFTQTNQPIFYIDAAKAVNLFVGDIMCSNGVIHVVDNLILQ